METLISGRSGASGWTLLSELLLQSLGAITIAVVAIVLFSGPFLLAARRLQTSTSNGFRVLATLGGGAGLMAYLAGSPSLVACVAIGYVLGGEFARLRRGRGGGNVHASSPVPRGKLVSAWVVMIVTALPIVRVARSWLPWGAPLAPYLFSYHLEFRAAEIGGGVLELRRADASPLHSHGYDTYLVEEHWLVGLRVVERGRDERALPGLNTSSL